MEFTTICHSCGKFFGMQSEHSIITETGKEYIVLQGDEQVTCSHCGRVHRAKYYMDVVDTEEDELNEQQRELT